MTYKLPLVWTGVVADLDGVETLRDKTFDLQSDEERRVICGLSLCLRLHKPSRLHQKECHDLIVMGLS
jgi:hypothetical protein